VGAWTLLLDDSVEPGGAQVSTFRPNPVGTLIFTPNGRYFLQIMRLINRGPFIAVGRQLGCAAALRFWRSPATAMAPNGGPGAGGVGLAIATRAVRGHANAVGWMAPCRHDNTGRGAQYKHPGPSLVDAPECRLRCDQLADRRIKRRLGPRRRA
jgi:hypothetical protein